MLNDILVPTAQKTIIFYDDEITAVIIGDYQDREIYVPLRPLCNYLGLDWSAQSRRINRDPILTEVVMSVAVTATDIDPGSRRPRVSDMLAIPLDYLNGWLFGVNANRVKVEVRDKVLQYQRECYRVLAREFVQTAVSPSPSSTLEHVYEMGLAIATLAQEQMQFERRLDKTDTAVQETAVAVDGLQKRVQELEIRTDPGEDITEEQASQVSQAVKAVAIVWGKQTGTSQFGTVYGELYRKFSVTSYKKIRMSQFENVMSWLNEWYQQLANEDLPF
ncbi:MAG: hypothetical protein GWP17_04965 [Aquificales bacterium]|nr:hypothetical protein [Aquificales bacterium]